jgi:hypothetical protein
MSWEKVDNLMLELVRPNKGQVEEYMPNQCQVGSVKGSAMGHSKARSRIYLVTMEWNNCD